MVGYIKGGGITERETESMMEQRRNGGERVNREAVRDKGGI